MQLNYNYSNSAGITVLSLQQHPCTQAQGLHAPDRKATEDRGNCRQHGAAVEGECREGKLAEMSEDWVGCWGTVKGSSWLHLAASRTVNTPARVPLTCLYQHQQNQI